MFTATKSLTVLLVCTALLVGAPAYANQSGPGIPGTLFIDLNGNGVQDAGEPVVPGVALELANGESVIQLTTAPDGSYQIPATPGLWRVTIVPLATLGISGLPGLELSVPQDITAELALDLPLGPSLLTELPPELLAELPAEFLPLGSFAEYADEVGAILGFLSGTADGDSADPELDPGSGAETDVYYGEYPEEDQLLVLLPESGSPAHPALRVAAGASVIAAMGLVMMLFGWKARRA